MENENMSIKEALHKAYKLGQESGEQLTTHFFRLKINWAFKEFKATNFYHSLSERDKTYIDEKVESYLRKLNKNKKIMTWG